MWSSIFVTSSRVIQRKVTHISRCVCSTKHPDGGYNVGDKSIADELHFSLRERRDALKSANILMSTSLLQHAKANLYIQRAKFFLGRGFTKERLTKDFKDLVVAVSGCLAHGNVPGLQDYFLKDGYELFINKYKGLSVVEKDSILVLNRNDITLCFPTEVEMNGNVLQMRAVYHVVRNVQFLLSQAKLQDVHSLFFAKELSKDMLVVNYHLHLDMKTKGAQLKIINARIAKADKILL